MNHRVNTLRLALAAFLIPALCILARAQEAAPPSKPGSFAQLADLDEPAADIAMQLREAPRDNAGKVKVAFFVFQNLDGATSRLGAYLSNAFAAALRSELSEVDFINQEQVTQQGKAAGLTNKQIADEDVAHYLATKAGAAVLITGTLENLGETVRLHVSATAAPGYKVLQTASATLAVPKEWPRLEAPAVSLPAAGRPSLGAAVVPSPEFGKRGIYPPECTYCPLPKYSTDAHNAKSPGTVVLRITVTAQGVAQNVGVMIPLENGLTERAILAVKGWRFEPARGPDGKPVVVEVLVEVTFRLVG